ncbi:DoxX family membrane protein [Shewanella eurypsychrophilus]|uniref:DoxX family membrane protein n=1 Tax=Shewanella eurypsychrophilus TaxID=2593656 RepID=A0ABX6V843_9GAMM|nr:MULTISPECIES: DoxX family membrane protein [Shewanella]QFU23588.1 DoxX family membrane protein [Shewanella sp. YLB-09]QPG58812.1 DoxX family membrane protein [Shewanella eurypsychrophilus]
MNTVLITSGRVLLALYFLLPGVMKFVSWDMHIALMANHNMVMIPQLLAMAAVFEISAAIALIFNRYTFIVSLLLAVLVLVINLNLHDFWNYTGIEGAHEVQNFVKNLGIFAGLLVLAGHAKVSAK